MSIQKNNVKMGQDTIGINGDTFVQLRHQTKQFPRTLVYLGFVDKTIGSINSKL